MTGTDDPSSRHPDWSFLQMSEDGNVSRPLLLSSVHRTGTDNESDQANRAISTGKLHALLHVHTRPINVVVFHGSRGRTRLEGGFPLRCLQRLSLPHVATLLCGWRHNRSTRGASIPVLSY